MTEIDIPTQRGELAQRLSDVNVEIDLRRQSLHERPRGLFRRIFDFVLPMRNPPTRVNELWLRHMQLQTLVIEKAVLELGSINDEVRLPDTGRKD